MYIYIYSCLIVAPVMRMGQCLGQSEGRAGSLAYGGVQQVLLS
jgi:hypothetical protein